MQRACPCAIRTRASTDDIESPFLVRFLLVAVAVSAGRDGAGRTATRQSWRREPSRRPSAAELLRDEWITSGGVAAAAAPAAAARGPGAAC